MSDQTPGDPVFERGLRTSRFEQYVSGQVGILCKHEGYVFLDNTPDGNQWLTHNLTLHRTGVPSSGGP